MGDLATLPTFAPSPASYTHADFNTAFANLTIANAAVTTNKIADAAVTLAKIATIAAATILGNNTGSAAAPIALTATQARSVLGLATTDNVTLGTLTVGTIASSARHTFTGTGLMLHFSNTSPTTGPYARWDCNGVGVGIIGTAENTVAGAASTEFGLDATSKFRFSINAASKGLWDANGFALTGDYSGTASYTSSGGNVVGNGFRLVQPSTDNLISLVRNDALVGSGSALLSAYGSVAIVAGATTTATSGTLVGTFSPTGLSVVGVGSYVDTNSRGFLTLGGGGAGGWSGIWMRGNNAQYAWMIGSSFLNSSTLEFTPSTAVGGMTFTTPIFTVATSGATVAGSLSVSDVAATSVLTSTTGTSRVAFNLVNTGGSYYLGVDNSTGSSFGGTAYALVRYAPSGRVIQDVINSAAITTVSSSGLAVTGTGSFTHASAGAIDASATGIGTARYGWTTNSTLRWNAYVPSGGTNLVYAYSATLDGSTNKVLDIATTGVTTTVPIIAPAATTSIPSIRLPHGAAPTTPTNGDLWTTTAGLYARINGATVGPFGAGGGGTVTAIGVTTANGVSGTSSGGATPNLTITLGAITPTTITMSGALSGATTISMSGALSGGTTADFSTEYRIAGTKVVGARGAAITTFSPTGTYATDQSAIATAINALIGRMQSHGLIS
jgi:hypothetical protein